MPGAVGLAWDLFARDQASPTFLRLAGAADKAAVATARATAGLDKHVATAAVAGKKLTQGLTLPLAGLAAVSVDQAAKWQKSMTLIQTAGGETAAKAAEISKGLMQIAKETGTSLGQLGEGIYTIAKAGAQKWTATEQLLVMKAAAQGAKAENVSLATATDALSTVMLDYHSKATDAVKVENQLIRASGLAKTNFGEFSSSLSNVVPIAAAAGLSFQEIGGAIATMTQHGVSAQQATENLRNLIFNLTGQNNVASQAMQQLGIDTVDLTKNLGKRGLTGTLAIVDKALADHTKHGMVVIDVQKAASLATKSLRTELGSFSGTLKDQSRGLLNGSTSIKEYTKFAKDLGGQAGASALQFLALYKGALGFSNQLRSGKGTITTSVAQYQKLLGGMTGAAVAMQIGGKYAADNARNVREVGKAALEAGSDVLGWNKTSETLAFKLDKAKTSLQVMAVEIGTALIPAVSKIADLFARGAHWFDGLDSGQKKLLGWTVGVMAALGPILTIGSRLILVGRALTGFATTATQAFTRIMYGTTEMSAGVRASIGRMSAALSGAAVGGIFGTLTKGSSDATKGVGALAAGLTGAAIGFGSGGPWGAAIGFAAGSLTSLATSFLGARNATQKETDALNAQKQAALELAGVLSSTPFNKQATAIKGNAIAQLTQSGAYDKANKYGIAPTTVTQAALGDYRAIQAATNAILKANGDLGKSWNNVSSTSKDAIRALNIDIFDATEKARQAEVDYENMSAAAGRLGFAHVKLSKEVKQFGTSLDTTTAYGQRNTFVLQTQIKDIANWASKQEAAGKSSKAVAAGVLSQVQAFRNAAAAAHFNMSTVDGLIASMLHLSKPVVMSLSSNADSQRQKIAALQRQIDMLHGKQIYINTIAVGGRPAKGPGASATGTGSEVLPHGWNWVGEGGPGARPELTYTTGRGTQVFSYPHAKEIANAQGWKVPGGYAGGTTPNPAWNVGGIQYASARAAQNARTRQDQSAMQTVVSNISALLAAAHNINASASDLTAAAKDLRSSAREQKLSASFQSLLARQASRLGSLGSARDRVNARLGIAPTGPTAYDQLATARQAYSDARSTTASAVGAFDFTTAGVSAQVFNDRPAAPVTAGSILTQLRAAAAKALRFAGLLKTLVKDGLPRDLVMQFAQAGPAAYDQAAALASASPKELLGIKSAYSQLNAAGGAAGSTVANGFYKAGVDSAQAVVNGLLSKRSLLNKAIRELGDEMVSELEHKLGIKQSPSIGHRKTTTHGGKSEIHVHGISDPVTFARRVETEQARRALARIP